MGVDFWRLRSSLCEGVDLLFGGSHCAGFWEDRLDDGLG
jgi:hypothetical protein